jgi:hypothetical protein
MGQRPIGVRIKDDEASSTPDALVVVSVGEAARRLGVSERTVFRLLKAGQLERVGSDLLTVKFANNDSHESDKSEIKRHNLSRILPSQRVHSAYDSHVITVIGGEEHVQMLLQQVREKDVQIAQMLQAQQDMAQTIRHLQQQMYELAHLVLTHNVAAAQAKAEAELKAQELASSRRGLANLLGARTRK